MDELTKDEQLQLAQIWLTGTVWAGDLISKRAAHSLRESRILHCNDDGLWTVAGWVEVRVSYRQKQVAQAGEYISAVQGTD